MRWKAGSLVYRERIACVRTGLRLGALFSFLRTCMCTSKFVRRFICIALAVQFECAAELNGILINWLSEHKVDWGQVKPRL